MTRYVYYLLFYPIFFSCTATFNLRQSNIKESDSIPECENLIRFVNKNWFKHKKYPCHKEFGKSFTFAQDFKPCLLKLHKYEVLQIFGQPDVEQKGNFRYIFSRDCASSFYNGHTYFEIIFKNNYVVDADSGIEQIAE